MPIFLDDVRKRINALLSYLKCNSETEAYQGFPQTSKIMTFDKTVNAS